ncbi:MAG TPA: hypothetical protein VL359_11400, partial [bacterium]|nr:hypothetical protein [bacterium]
MPTQRGRLQRGAAALTLLAALLAVGACSSTRQEQARLSALHFFNQGNQAFAEEDYLRAAHLYQEAIHLDGRSAVLYYNLGLSYQWL